MMLYYCSGQLVGGGLGEKGVVVGSIEAIYQRPQQIACVFLVEITVINKSITHTQHVAGWSEFN